MSQSPGGGGATTSGSPAVPGAGLDRKTPKRKPSSPLVEWLSEIWWRRAKLYEEEERAASSGVPHFKFITRATEILPKMVATRGAQTEDPVAAVLGSPIK